MKILFHFTITLLVLSLAACNQTKSPEPVKQYTFIGGKEGDKMDTTSFDSLQLSDPFILADEETQMYYLVGSGGSLWKSTNMKKWTGPYQYITVDTTSWIEPRQEYGLRSSINIKVNTIVSLPLPIPRS